MMAIVTLVFFMMTWIPYCYGDSSEVVNFSAERVDLNIHFAIDAVGSTRLQVIKGTQRFNCSPKIKDFIVNEPAHIPYVEFTFDMSVCKNKLETKELKIFDSASLVIDLTDKRFPLGHFQWLKGDPPNVCKFEKFSLVDLRLDYKKWKDGNWGWSPSK